MIAKVSCSRIKLKYHSSWSGSECMTKLKRVSKNATVKQSNNLTVARYTLSLLEQRLMFAICSQIDKNASDFEKIRFSVNELADLCNIKGDRKYDDIKRVSVSLMKRLVTIPTADGGEYITHWLQSQRYYPSDSSIEFKIDSDLRGELLQLKKAYVNTPVSMLVSFKKKYSSRMYLILKKMLKIGDFEYSLDFFRETFQLAETYKKFSNIKNGVIEPAIEELNQSSDLDILHEYVKEGRFFTKIHFCVKSKNNEMNVIAQDKRKSVGAGKLPDEQQGLFDRLVNRGISIRKARAIVKKYDPAVIERNLKYAVQQKNTATNLPGLIVTFIEQDTAGENLKAKQEARARIEQRQKERREAYQMFHGTPKAATGKEDTIPEARRDELNDIEVEIIQRKGMKAGKIFLKKMERLGLTVEDVMAGRRK